MNASEREKENRKTPFVKPELAKVICLRCRVSFMSPNKRYRRLCDKCNRLNSGSRPMNPTKELHDD